MQIWGAIVLIGMAVAAWWHIDSSAIEREQARNAAAAAALDADNRDFAEHERAAATADLSAIEQWAAMRRQAIAETEYDGEIKECPANCRLPQ